MLTARPSTIPSPGDIWERVHVNPASVFMEQSKVIRITDVDSFDEWVMGCSPHDPQVQFMYRFGKFFDCFVYFPHN